MRLCRTASWWPVTSPRRIHKAAPGVKTHSRANYSDERRTKAGRGRKVRPVFAFVVLVDFGKCGDLSQATDQRSKLRHGSDCDQHESDSAQDVIDTGQGHRSHISPWIFQVRLPIYHRAGPGTLTNTFRKINTFENLHCEEVGCSRPHSDC